MTDTDLTAPEETPAPPDPALALASQRHALKIAVLQDRADKAAKAAEAARLAAAPDYAVLRNSGHRNVDAAIPGMAPLGLVSIFAGAKRTDTDEELLVLCAAPGDLETYVLAAALEDGRVRKFIEDNAPDLLGCRIKPTARAEFAEQIDKHDGWVLNRMTGEREKVATITRHLANGRCQYKRGDRASEQIAEAIAAGLITEDGEIPGQRYHVAPAAVPAADVPRELVFRPDNGPAPTDEQAAIVDEYGQGSSLVVNAYAGSGKTSILRMLAAASPRTRLQYVAYGAVAKQDAAKSFPRNATCSTSHGLAFRPMIHMAQRIGATKYVPGTRLAEIMGITGPAQLTADRMLARGQLASVVKATITKFCYSADEEITGRNVPRDLKWCTSPEELAALQEIIPPIARRIWTDDITAPAGAVPMEHDFYLKAFQLTHPRLRGDVIALDEAQDSNPCVASMICEQRQYGTQIIMVGDTYQAIYGWRGATDAMAGFALESGVKVLSLTKSFRFGPEIAAEGNKWLWLLGADKQLRGYEKISSRIGPVPGTGDAILCRTNAEALKQAIAALAKDLKVAFPKGAGDLMALTRGAADIKAGRPSEHQDLMAFATWGQVQDFVENDHGGADLQLFVDLVDEHGPEKLLGILSQIGSAEKGDIADIVIGTAHSAKGLEWPLVEIAGDFLEPKGDPDALPGELPEIPREMAMLAYVAVTRAKHVLNQSGLAWVDKFLPASQVRAA